MRTKGIHGVQLDIEVPFFDVDMMQVVWHGHYVKYLEQARRALFADLGCDYLAMQAWDMPGRWSTCNYATSGQPYSANTSPCGPN